MEKIQGIQIYNIELSKIEPFRNHPFKVTDDDTDMLVLMDSIRTSGVVVPALVRKIGNERYELISGHRRKRASELLGLKSMPCQIVRGVDNYDATVLMVESNIHRSSILPSEKAFAFRMLIESLKHQGKKQTSSPVDKKSKLSAEEVGALYNESAAQVYRFIRLTYLCDQLLKRVDEGQIKLRPGVELSYLSTDFQLIVDEEIEKSCATPSHAQARKLRAAFEEGTLTGEVIKEIISEEKPNQAAKIVLNRSRFDDVMPKGLSENKQEEYIYKALMYYLSHNHNE